MTPIDPEVILRQMWVDPTYTIRRSRSHVSSRVDSGRFGALGFRVEDIKDSLSRTIMVVEAGLDKAVPWTKPEDLPVDLGIPIAALDNVADEGFFAVFFDGQVQLLPKAIDPKLLRSMISPKELQHLNGLGHPNIVRVFDANTAETPRGTCGFFTM